MRFIDTQVNGFAGVSFHQEPLTQEQIYFVARRLRAGEVRAILPTITTDDLGKMAARLAGMRKWIDQDEDLRKLMPAFHIEGPCISPLDGYRGAHPKEHVIPASREAIEPLIEAAGGVKNVAMVTIAPEHDKDFKATRWMAELGIIVCAGHTDASLECLREAEKAGLSFYTHLGNGSAAQMNRHDNIINRVMSLETIRYSIIHDGHHVPFWLAKQWIDWLGVDRCVFTTDCVEAADTPEDFDVSGGRYVDRSNGTPVVRLTGTPYLAGAALTPAQGYRNAIEKMGLSEDDANWMSCDGPAKLLAKWLV